MGPTTDTLFQLEILEAPRQTESPNQDVSTIAATISGTRSDWPGKRAVSIVIGGCNLACPYCFDPEHASTHGSPTTLAELVGRVATRPVIPEALVVTGGEPTTASNLVELLRALKALDIPTKLDTNGTNAEMLRTILADNLVDYVALDVKTSFDRYDALTKSPGTWQQVARSIEILISSGVDHEMRTTCYPFAVSPSDLPSIAAHLVGARRYVLQQFVPRRTLDPAASSAIPHPADELRRAALRCSVHVPTMVRGV
jgi:pyruvate formate lyase activating enzyme